MITPSALLRDTVASLASLRLTVALLVLASVLVVLATLDQINLGVWAAQQKYLRTFVVTLTPAGSTFQIPVFPGGYLVGGALLILVGAAVWKMIDDRRNGNSACGGGCARCHGACPARRR